MFMLAAIARTPAGAGGNDLPTSKERGAMAGVALAFMRAHSVPGLSVAVARHGELVYQEAFGFADRDQGERVTPAHLFRIASISKPITAVAIFHLIEHGRLKLEDLVFGPDGILQNDFGPLNGKPYVGAVRVKHLLTHTGGGWPNDRTDPMFQNLGMDHRNLITWALAHVPLSHPPGEHYAYSNFGYCILGRIVEKMTGLPYEQYVRDAILNRCGIADARIAGNTREERAPGEVVYYPADDEDPYDLNVRRMDSHGGWLATAPDLVRFATHVDGFSTARDILRPASIHAMTTPTAVNAQYAKGWSVNNAHNWWHNGTLPGATSILMRTASGLCWAALANTREGEVDTAAALDKMMWDLVGQVKRWNV